MEKRFRREKNIISHRVQKKTHENQHKTKKADTDTTENEDESPLEHLSHTYTSIQTKSLIRDTVLLWGVLVILLFSAAWALPRVFSFHLDINSIIHSFVPETLVAGNEEKSTKDLDILILGRWGEENDAPDLTDSIILGHYNDTDPASFVTLSIPRDLYVHSKILGRVKINELYAGTKKSLGAEGAFDHLLDMVGQITGREVKYYAMIDFSGFRKLIDQVGGIDIDVPERLYDNEYPTRWWWYTIVDIAPGPQHFDGDKALKYARSRHTTSDFDRSRRQQLVISALQEKMLSLDILSSPRKLEGIWNVLRSSVTTNLTIGQLISLAQKATKVTRDNIVWHTLDNTCFDALRLCHPGGLLYTPDRELFWGASVLLPKKATGSNIAIYDRIQLFTSIIVQYPKLLSEFPITIVNASGKTNLALSVSLQLRSIGFPVDEKQIRNQKEKVDKTFIRYNSLIIKPQNEVLHALSSLASIQVREATPEERVSMVGSYELVLGSDSSLYF